MQSNYPDNLSPSDRCTKNKKLHGKSVLHGNRVLHTSGSFMPLSFLLILLSSLHWVISHSGLLLAAGGLQVALVQDGGDVAVEEAVLLLGAQTGGSQRRSVRVLRLPPERRETFQQHESMNTGRSR